jgi:hypothetical protein
MMRRCTMTIQDRNLKPGTRLVARYHKQQYKCEVVETEGGKLGYRLEDGREFKSPSAAGTAITSKACNGWAFWSLETSPAPTAPEAETASTQTDAVAAITEDKKGDGEEKKEEPAITPAQPKVELQAAKRRFSRVPNQKGVTAGQTRWHCYECGQSFLAPTGRTPEGCPLEHPTA